MTLVRFSIIGAAMGPRDWLVLALRVVGFWAILDAIRELSSLATAVYALIVYAATVNVAEDFFSRAFGSFAYGALSAFLLLESNWIASKFYPDESIGSTASQCGTFTIKSAYELALRLLGIYALLFVLGPLTQAIFLISNKIDWSEKSARGQVLYLLFQSGAFAFSGAFILMFARRLARCFARNGDSDVSREETSRQVG